MTLIFILIIALFLGSIIQIALDYKQRCDMYLKWNRVQTNEIDKLRRLVDAYEAERRSGNDTGGETQDNGRDRKEPPKTVSTAQTGS